MSKIPMSAPGNRIHLSQRAFLALTKALLTTEYSGEAVALQSNRIQRVQG
jgi:hypothetical protein